MSEGQKVVKEEKLADMERLQEMAKAKAAECEQFIAQQAAAGFMQELRGDEGPSAILRYVDMSVKRGQFEVWAAVAGLK
jgi:hypothetical protein